VAAWYQAVDVDGFPPTNRWSNRVGQSIDWPNIEDTEFALNSSSSATTGFAPFELSGGYMPSFRKELNMTTPFKGVKQFAKQAKWNIIATHDTIIANCVVQTDQVNRLHSDSPDYKVGDLVYLLTENLSLPKGQAKKLCHSSL
jgi:hypothetical protein